MVNRQQPFIYAFCQLLFDLLLPHKPLPSRRVSIAATSSLALRQLLCNFLGLCGERPRVSCHIASSNLPLWKTRFQTRSKACRNCVMIQRVVQQKRGADAHYADSELLHAIALPTRQSLLSLTPSNNS